MVKLSCLVYYCFSFFVSTYPDELFQFNALLIIQTHKLTIENEDAYRQSNSLLFGI